MPDLPQNGPPDQSNQHPGGLFPLDGITVLVTRAAEQAQLLCVRLEDLGAQTIVHPVIQILPPEDTSGLDRGIERIDQFEWLVFVSTNAVRYFLERFRALGGSPDSLRCKKIAAIGQSTAAWLEEHADLQVDLIPPTSNSQGLGESLLSAVGNNQKLLIARADRRTSTLTDLLSESAVKFEEVITYRTCDVSTADPAVASQMANGAVDWVTITSGAIARAAFRIFGDEIRKTHLVSISPATSRAIGELGLEPAAEATDYDMAGIVESIRQFEDGKPQDPPVGGGVD